MKTILVLLLLTASAMAANEQVAPIDDAAKGYISIVGTPAQTASVVKMFESGALKDIKNKTHFAVVDPSSPIYAERYAKNQGSYAIAAFPCLRVQDKDGVVVYQAGGSQLAANRTELAAELSIAIDFDRVRGLFLRRNRNQQNTTPATPDQCRPDGGCSPKPPIQALLELNKPELPPEPEPESPLVLVALAALVLGIVVGFAVSLVKRGEE